ncbi:Sucrose phosphorylase [Maioricimonas rarisocia]|uniref:Sucrose phosphorylase n=1 Tax=Maioricimonas rarisocia TaxID=2528026 RepID=A0A517Z2U3_9PLAN|nr:alpha-amylase family glycosyl hydrolase [Maioricimonas rarisocia]QDU36783.1 Sucrose phosphorylase [Maioricimonas rarisocia]
MPLTNAFRPRIAAKLNLLYPNQADAVLSRIDELADRYRPRLAARDGELWDERSILLITYGDQVGSGDRPTMAVLDEFLREFGFDDLLTGVHLLPFYPYSSDDGFSVIDYRAVKENMGDWSDVERLSRSFELMFDFVLNHCSQYNERFQKFLQGKEPYTEYFHAVDPAEDLSSVTRPRSSPLLTPFETDRGTQHVWTTFSADQVDLNFSCPDLLIEMLEILLDYVERGARLIRLDAIGFLWKTLGTNCMHLPETHAVVKIMRDLLDDVAPGTIVITETNVPHVENISYFGDGDEAHAVYQFSLAPLLLDAFATGDVGPLLHWLEALEYFGPGMTFFNFTASHDGIGVRPLEGLVGPDRLDRLVEHVRDLGGRVSMRRKPDGSESPYELNITYFSALNTVEGLAPEEHARRFLTSQGIMLALRGMPGIYFHSLVGTPNWQEGVEQTGHNRTINRRKFDVDELRAVVSAEGTAQQIVFDGYRKMLATRIAQPAFHPDAPQSIVPTGHPAVIGFLRTSLDGTQHILVLANVGSAPVELDLTALCDVAVSTDLLSGQSVDSRSVTIEPAGLLWLT